MCACRCLANWFLPFAALKARFKIILGDYGAVSVTCCCCSTVRSPARALGGCLSLFLLNVCRRTIHAVWGGGNRSAWRQHNFAYPRNCQIYALRCRVAACRGNLAGGFAGAEHKRSWRGVAQSRRGRGRKALAGLSAGRPLGMARRQTDGRWAEGRRPSRHARR